MLSFAFFFVATIHLLATPENGHAFATALLEEDEEEDDSNKEDDEDEDDDDGDKGKEDEGKPKDDTKKKPEGTGGDGEDGKGGKTEVPANLSPDERYIREKLQDYLHPSTVKFEKDGRVILTFDFRKKSEEQEKIFSCKFGHGIKDAFRWTFRDEEWVIGGDIGLRLSDRGMAMINAWFTDDVEAEMEFLQCVNHAARHTAALIYATEKGKALGSNYGGQCAIYLNGQAQKTAGQTIPVVFNQIAKIKLAIQNELLEAHRQGKKKAELKFTRKGFEAGRIGILWGGSMAAIVPSLTITGKFDIKKMAAEMRKYFGDK
ncbi:MAG: hypothetical protein HY717_11730 [Planctomycetes bacterium]|nr:hypothetical protein [Planctomycetota bacterium]